MKISKNSSLYKLLRMGWMSERQTERTNLCVVFWVSLWGLCMTAALIVAASAVGYALIVGPIISLIGFFVTGVWAPDDGVVIGLVVDTMMTILFSIGVIAMKWEELKQAKRDRDPDYAEKQYQRRLERERNPGLLRTAYRSWKDKTCVMIQFEDAE